MDQWYNFYNFEALFKQYLLAENNSPITIKNYLSDLRHFLGWVILKLLREASSQSAEKVEKITSEEFIALIDAPLIEEYKQYLITNNIPQKTINRRLSTLRKFFTFCILQGWQKDNPAKKVNNLIASKNELLSDFQQYLMQKRGLSTSEIKNINDDINGFLNFISYLQ
jgi:site-specific recombinase XerD